MSILTFIGLAAQMIIFVAFCAVVIWTAQERKVKCPHCKAVFYTLLPETYTCFCKKCGKRIDR